MQQAHAQSKIWFQTTSQWQLLRFSLKSGVYTFLETPEGQIHLLSDRDFFKCQDFSHISLKCPTLPSLPSHLTLYLFYIGAETQEIKPSPVNTAPY